MDPVLQLEGCWNGTSQVELALGNTQQCPALTDTEISRVLQCSLLCFGGTGPAGEVPVIKQSPGHPVDLQELLGSRLHIPSLGCHSPYLCGSITYRVLSRELTLLGARYSVSSDVLAVHGKKWPFYYIFFMDCSKRRENTSCI